jgi:hypothetical protein
MVPESDVKNVKWTFSTDSNLMPSLDIAESWVAKYGWYVKDYPKRRKSIANFE